MRACLPVLLVALAASASVSAQDIASGAPGAGSDASQSVIVLRTAADSLEVGAPVQAVVYGPEALSLAAAERPNSGTVLVMGFGGALAAGAFAAGTLESNNEWAFWLAPLVGGGTTYALGEIMGYRGDPLRSAGATALGAIPGAVVLAFSLGRVENQDLGDLGADDILLFLGGYTLYTAIPPMLAARMHYLSPAVHTAPGGEAVPGLSMRIGL